MKELMTIEDTDMAKYNKSPDDCTDGLARDEITIKTTESYERE